MLEHLDYGINQYSILNTQENVSHEALTGKN